jgi:hypothetical protein
VSDFVQAAIALSAFLADGVLIPAVCGYFVWKEIVR